jgi:hypothetical protein
MIDVIVCHAGQVAHSQRSYEPREIFRSSHAVLTRGPKRESQSGRRRRSVTREAVAVRFAQPAGHFGRRSQTMSGRGCRLVPRMIASARPGADRMYAIPYPPSTAKRSSSRRSSILSVLTPYHCISDKRQGTQPTDHGQFLKMGTASSGLWRDGHTSREATDLVLRPDAEDILAYAAVQVWPPPLP